MSDRSLKSEQKDPLRLSGHLVSGLRTSIRNISQRSIRQDTTTTEKSDSDSYVSWNSSSSDFMAKKKKKKKKKKVRNKAVAFMEEEPVSPKSLKAPKAPRFAAEIPFDKELKIEIVNCQGLIAGDSNGLSDPCVEILMGTQVLHETAFIKKTLNPVFSADHNNSYILKCSAEELWNNKGLTFVVKDHDYHGPLRRGSSYEELGLVKVPAKRLYKATGKVMTLPLKAPRDSELSEGNSSFGSISICVRETKLADTDKTAAAEAEALSADSFYQKRGRGELGFSIFQGGSSVDYRSSSSSSEDMYLEASDDELPGKKKDSEKKKKTPERKKKDALKSDGGNVNWKRVGTGSPEKKKTSEKNKKMPEKKKKKQIPSVLEDDALKSNDGTMNWERIGKESPGKKKKTSEKNKKTPEKNKKAAKSIKTLKFSDNDLPTRIILDTGDSLKKKADALESKKVDVTDTYGIDDRDETADNVWEKLYERDEKIMNLEIEVDTLKEENKNLRLEIKRRRYSFKASEGKDADGKASLAEKDTGSISNQDEDESPTSGTAIVSSSILLDKSTAPVRAAKSDVSKVHISTRSPSEISPKRASNDGSVDTSDDDAESVPRLLGQMGFGPSFVCDSSLYSFIQDSPSSVKEEKADEDPNEAPAFDRKKKDAQKFSKMPFCGVANKDASNQFTMPSLAFNSHRSTYGEEEDEDEEFENEMIGVTFDKDLHSVHENRNEKLHEDHENLEQTLTTVVSQTAIHTTTISGHRILELEREVQELKQELKLKSQIGYQQPKISYTIKAAEANKQKLESEVDRLQRLNKIQTQVNLELVKQAQKKRFGSFWAFLFGKH